MQHTETAPIGGDHCITDIIRFCIILKCTVKFCSQFIGAWDTQKLIVFLQRYSDWPSIAAGMPAVTAFALESGIIIGNYISHFFDTHFLELNTIKIQNTVLIIKLKTNFVKLKFVLSSYY
jgi:hypothetical protein